MTRRSQPRPPSKRGGPHNRGKVLSNNTSGLNALRFSWQQHGDWLVAYVHTSWIDNRGQPRRTSFSVDRNGTIGALARAIEPRAKVGLPVPDMATALSALVRFLQR